MVNEHPYSGVSILYKDPTLYGTMITIITLRKSLKLSSKSQPGAWFTSIPTHSTLREESSQTNVILQYKLLASILSAVCSVIQQSYYALRFYYTLYNGKYDCKITTH